MLWLLGLMHLVLSLGDVNALIPIIIILILIVAAGGLTRGFDIFSLFGLASLTGIGLGSRASMARKSAYDPRQPADFRSSSTSGVNAAEAKKIREQLKDKQISRREAYRKLGAVKGEAGGTPSLAAGVYKTYKTLAGKDNPGFAQSNAGPFVLSKYKNPDDSKNKLTVKQVNDQVAHRVRMAVLNPAKHMPKKRGYEQPSYSGENTLPFSSVSSAAAWVLSGRSGQEVKTAKMRKLAAKDPAAFRKEYDKIVRRELYKHMVDNKMKEKGSSFRMPTDKKYHIYGVPYLKMPAKYDERRKFRYTGTIYKEWGRGMKRTIKDQSKTNKFGYAIGRSKPIIGKKARVYGEKNFTTGKSEHHIYIGGKERKLNKKKKP